MLLLSLRKLLERNILLMVNATLLQSCPTFCDHMDVALQAPLSMGFSREGCWSGLPCPPPGDLPYPGIEPVSLTSPLLAGRFFTTTIDSRQKEIRKLK